ncbi:MAG: polysaccharide export protein Wza [Bacteroidetes bacterium]|nr:polysaccharide export protein Wza [Bacteroidota bacterium]
MVKKIYYLLGILVLFSLSSCRVFYANEMFKQKDYQFFELAKKKVEEYVIEPGDELTLEVYSRDGFKLVDVLGGSLATTQGSTAASATTGNGLAEKPKYLVDKEGFAKFPVLGMLYVKGYTQNELETQLAQRYASLFVNPFAILKVTNRRVFVFKGDVGMVVDLNNAPTSLPEVLARSGGLARNLKAYKIKIIRGDMANPQVRIIDLSTLEGLRSSDLIVQSNDIIYVEQRKAILNDISQSVSPVVTPIISVIGLIVSITLLSRTIK